MRVDQARIMHRFLSRSEESDALSALRHARGHPLTGRPPQAYSLSTLRRPGVPALRVAQAVRTARRMISSLQ